MVFITVKSTIEKVAQVPDLYILVTAFIPSGVAAPPAPSILVAIFSDTYSRVLSDSLGNSRFTIGDSSLDMRVESPLDSITAIIPDHKQYTARRDKARFIPLSVPSIRAGRNPSGLRKIIKTILKRVTNIQTLLILQ